MVRFWQEKFRLLPALAIMCLPVLALSQFRGESYELFDISALNANELAALKARPNLIWWVELDEQLLVRAKPGWQSPGNGVRLIRRFPYSIEDDRLMFLRLPKHGNWKDADVLAMGGRFAVIRGGGTTRLPLRDGLETLPDRHSGHQHERPGYAFRPNTVLARSAARWPDMRSRAKDAATERLLDHIDPERWFADLFYLACINRYSLADEINDATWWLAEQLRELPGMDVTVDAFPFRGTRGRNVVGVLTGSERPDDWFIVGAHYDSISEAPLIAAPGAEDNASGTAAILEMARIFAENPPESTLIFVCYSAEEQGLFGSQFHAQSLVNGEHQGKVKGVLTMDMISYTADADLDCLLETGEPGEGLLTPLMSAAETYTNLRIVVSLFPFGSDHVPYLNRSMPAVLTIENDWNQYPGYHRTTDTPENISLEMGLAVLRMNVAALAEMAGFNPASPFKTRFRDAAPPTEPP